MRRANAPHRGGSALFVTILTVGLIAWLLLNAATAVKARQDSAELIQAKKQAMYAAEAAASLKEVELVRMAATNDLLELATRSTRTTAGGEQVWDGDDIFFAGCRVRWRIEPVVVANSDNYTVNPAPDPTVVPPATASIDGTDRDHSTNFDFYNYRIATEAYALADPADPDAEPWNEPLDRVAVAQATRVVQLRLTTLFKYALFYAAVGPEGDIEFHNGPPLNIGGSVHSNGAIYFGGDKEKYWPGDNGDVTIGSATSRKSVVAIDGIYRSQKRHVYQSWIDGFLPSLEPRHLPLPAEQASVFEPSLVASVPMEGSNNANGGLKDPTGPQTSTTYSINGVAMNPGVNDSRNPSEMAAAWGPLVRDGVTRGATVVRTLANIPELGGRPFEDGRRVTDDPDTPMPLWVRDPLNGDFTLTIQPNDPPEPYYFDPFGEIDGDPDNDFDFVKGLDPLTGVPAGSYLPDVIPNGRNRDEYLVAGDYDLPDDATGRARRLYYAVDPATVSDGDKTAIFSGAYDEDGDPGNVPGLPSYIQTEPTDWPVLAGGMRIWHQRDGDGDALFLPGGGSPITDVTDPIANPFDQTRSWYLADRDDHYAKRIHAAGATVDPDPLVDRDGSGNEQDGFRINQVLGVYAERGLYGGSNQDPGFGLVIRERPSQATHFWNTGLPDPTGATSLPWAAAGPDEGGDGAFLESAGQVVVEAEHFHASQAGSGNDWTASTNWGSPSAGGSMQALPDAGTNYNDAADFTVHSPRLDYEIEFATAGTWYVSLRGAGPDGSGDSCHLGLDGAAQSGADRASLDNSANLAWTRSDMDSNRLTLSVPTAGVHVLNLWMREDGAVVDKIVLSTDSATDPSGTGPTESARAASGVQAPYAGSPATIAATGSTLVQAEEYDTGGLDVAFADANATNEGGVTGLRTAGDEWDLDQAGGVTWIGAVEAGDWYEYTLEVDETGIYDISVRTSSLAAGGANLHVEVAGSDLTGTIAVPQTAGWSSFVETTVADVPLAAGVHTFRVVFDTGNVALDRLSLDRSGDFELYTEQLADYLKSQYQVYFGTTLIGGEIAHRDITELFFDHGASAAADPTQMVGYESWVQNRRETGFMGWMFDIDGDEGIDLEDFRVNWLTLNMDRVCEFIRETPLATVDPSVPVTDTRTLAAEFNGMVYVHRTRRSATVAPTGSDDFTGHEERDTSDQPLLPPGYHPIWNPDWARPKDAVAFETSWGSGDWIAPPHLQTDPLAASAARVRCGSGPDCTFQSGLRLRNGSGLQWGGTTVSATGDVRARGTTVICANPVFLHGDYNTTLYDASGSAVMSYPALNTDGDPYVSDTEFDARPSGVELPPAAVFCDSLSVLSNAWDDATVSFGSLGDAADTWYNTSVVTNNVPTYLYNGASLVVPSGGPHNLIRYLEKWSGDWYHIKGSTVVMGVSKFTLAEAGWSGNTRTSGQKYYSPPKRDIQFNTDLFTRPGQPPFTPFGVTVIRTVQTVNLRDLALKRDGE